MQYRLINAHINSNNNAATSHKNLVNIGPVTLEFKKGECRVLAAIRLQFDDQPSFGTLAFRNELEYHNFDFSRVIGNHFCNLVEFFSLQNSTSTEM